ncbi:suppressor protein SRP40-like isoform X1 [Melia azedarach]|uniref:Suppressor protein SRP40-like isoform X1 n=1 Tax=Melia azedarach TaxID=155640 RepID=A0ACC1X0M2_MELAZ|nr:suppressor protein SRP40-like isoform X1 [Melia azedarach]
MVSTVEKKMIGSGKLEDGKWSEKKVEAKDDLRTVECLRGRLLAERQASRLANEEAELIGKKLIELENKLKEETKQRNKAEKKLKFLKKKLESLKISIPSEESEQSSSSDICAHSCKSSASASGIKDTEESESKSQITTPEIPENLENNALSETISSNQSHETSSIPENSSLLDSANSSTKDIPDEIPIQSSSPSSDDPKTDNHSRGSKKAEMEADQNESDKENQVDNTLAIVPVNSPNPNERSQNTEVKKISNGNVREALEALRLAREMIQSSVGRRHVIRVGHS